MDVPVNVKILHIRLIFQLLKVFLEAKSPGILLSQPSSSFKNLLVERAFSRAAESKALECSSSRTAQLKLG